LKSPSGGFRGLPFESRLFHILKEEAA